MGFDVEEVDLTLKPDLLVAKGIRAVPVVAAGEQRLVGHATSEQRAALIRDVLVPTRLTALAGSRSVYPR
ncbi:MAG: hypothetical protein M5U01_06775 [Ardenticatenaceae bacterium]|nr:hypothetical protein [Ardenticatenaceae bacterium]